MLTADAIIAAMSYTSHTKRCFSANLSAFSLLTIAPENVVYEPREHIKRLRLFIAVLVPVIDALHSGLNMTKHPLGMFVPDACTAHQEAGSASEIMKGPTG